MGEQTFEFELLTCINMLNKKKRKRNANNSACTLFIGDADLVLSLACDYNVVKYGQAPLQLWQAAVAGDG